MSEAVDSSPEAIAAIVDRLYLDRESGRPHWRDCYRAAIMLAQVARERDEAVERITRWRAENGGRYWEARFRDEEIRAEAAERRLAEARAVLDEFEHDGRLQTFEDRERFRVKARALLSGETTRVTNPPLTGPNKHGWP